MHTNQDNPVCAIWLRPDSQWWKHLRRQDSGPPGARPLRLACEYVTLSGNGELRLLDSGPSNRETFLHAEPRGPLKAEVEVEEERFRGREGLSLKTEEEASSPGLWWPLEAGTGPRLTGSKETGTPVLQPPGAEID